jgi:hypothetical protein
MQSIELGMTREQVNATGARWLPGHPYGRAPSLGAEPPAELAFFHHGRGGRYFAADYCEVTFAADRVACVELVAD